MKKIITLFLLVVLPTLNMYAVDYQSTGRTATKTTKAQSTKSEETKWNNLETPVQRTFFSAISLGDQKIRVKEYVKIYQWRVIEKGDEIVFTQPMRFAGEDWDCVTLRFFGERLEQISFLKKLDENVKLYNTIGRRLLDKLSEKYKRKVVGDIVRANDVILTFMDEKTNGGLVMKEGISENNPCTILMVYSDIQLSEERSKKEIDEL